ncbi:hypothetical protein D3C87_1821120 [compost metagenome]
MLAFFFQEQIHDILRGQDAELLRIELPRLAQYFAQDLVAHGARRAHIAPRFAHGAGLAQLMRKRIPRALARHFHQAQLREAIDRHARAVTRQRLFQFSQHGVAVLLFFHINEVQDNDAPQVA